MMKEGCGGQMEGGEEGGDREGKTNQTETRLPRSSTECSILLGGTHKSLDVRTVCLRVFADPELAVCGVDGGEMDGGSGVDGDEAEMVGCGVCLAGKKGSGGDEGEESGEDGEWCHHCDWLIECLGGWRRVG